MSESGDPNLQPEDAPRDAGGAARKESARELAAYIKAQLVVLGSAFQTFSPDLEFVERVYQATVYTATTNPHALYEHFPAETMEKLRKKVANAKYSEFTPESWKLLGKELADMVQHQLEIAELSLRKEEGAEAAVSTIIALAEENRMRRRVVRAEKSITEALKEVTDSAQHVKEVVGAEAQGELSEFYGKYADKENRAAEIMRALAVVLTLGIVAFLVVSLSSSPGSLSWLELARKAAIGIPVGALALYLSRESSRHRQKAAWAERVTVKLRTVKAYTDPLPTSLRDEIRADFGRQIFVADGIENSQKSIDEPPDNLNPMLSKIVDLIRSKEAKS